MNLNLSLTSYTRITSKWIMDLHVEYKTKKLIEKLGEKRQDLQLSKKFLGLTPEVQSLKGKIDKLDFIKIKNVWFIKNLMMRLKRQVYFG